MNDNTEAREGGKPKWKCRQCGADVPASEVVDWAGDKWHYRDTRATNHYCGPVDPPAPADALKKYGTHLWDCPKLSNNKATCTCGLDAALRGDTELTPEEGKP